MPEAPNPAKRPERGDTISPEDIAVGEEEDTGGENRRGRRALRRPRGSAGEGEMGVGTGLSA